MAVGTAPRLQSRRGWWRCRRCSTSMTTARCRLPHRRPARSPLPVRIHWHDARRDRRRRRAAPRPRWCPISTRWSESGRPSMRRLTLITTGGTIEKVYDEGGGALVNRTSQVRRMLAGSRLEDTEISVLELMSKDSLDMSDGDRRRILDAARRAGAASSRTPKAPASSSCTEPTPWRPPGSSCIRSSATSPCRSSSPAPSVRSR